MVKLFKLEIGTAYSPVFYTIAPDLAAAKEAFDSKIQSMFPKNYERFEVKEVDNRFFLGVVGDVNFISSNKFEELKTDLKEIHNNFQGGSVEEIQEALESLLSKLNGLR